MASVGTVRVVDLAVRAAGGPTAGPAVRVGADQARRRRHPAAARGRRRIAPTRSAPAPGCTRTGSTSRSARSPTSRTSRSATRRSRAAARRRRPGSGDHAGDARVSIEIQHTASLAGERLSAGARGGQAARCAHRQGREGLLPAARGRSGHRPADRRVRRAARQGHGDDVRDHQHPVRRASGSSRRTSRPTCCSTAPTSRSCTWSPRSTPPRCGWACGWRRCGSPARSGASASTTSSTSGRPGEPDADYDTYKHHL